tara:strand:+ start:58 stop:495 length:438 start_codon:yes stop_codon:yes gene_type:complete
MAYDSKKVRDAKPSIKGTDEEINKIFRRSFDKYNKVMDRIDKNVKTAEAKGIRDKTKRSEIRAKNQLLYDNAIKELNRDKSLLLNYGTDAMKARSFGVDTATKKKDALESLKKRANLDLGAKRGGRIMKMRGGGLATRGTKFSIR